MEKEFEFLKSPRNEDYDFNEHDGENQETLSDKIISREENIKKSSQPGHVEKLKLKLNAIYDKSPDANVAAKAGNLDIYQSISTAVGKGKDSDYVVKNKNAGKYKEGKSFENDDGTVDQGSIVVLLEKNKDGKHAKVSLTDESTTWLKIEDIQLVTKVTDDETYTVAYDDVFLYTDPIGKTTGTGKKTKTTHAKKTVTKDGKTTNQTVELNKKVKIINRYGKFAYIKGVGKDETIYGWVNESNLFNQAKTDRRKYLSDYKTWLETRLIETKAIEPKEMVEQAKAFLSEIEKVSVSVNSSNPTYPSIKNMSKTPAINEGADRSQVPHELIGVTRKFIELQEKTAPEAKDSKNAAVVSNASVAGGSLYENIDWNKRLGVPQYRSQSDNLLAPEATCVPTVYSMILERLGLNRTDIIAAIDANLKKNNQTFNRRAKDYFDKEDGVFKAVENNKKREKLLKANEEAAAKKKPLPYNSEAIPALMTVPSLPNEGKQYQRLRSGQSGGMTGNEEDLANEFKAKGQSEDLLGFLGYLLGYSKRQEISLSTINVVANNEKSKYTEETLSTWSPVARAKMKETLDAGGSILLGVYHKGGDKKAGHVVMVQAVTEKGLIVDDPYGGGNTDYRFKEKDTDFYAPTGSMSRTWTYKNKPHYSPNDAIDKQDFWLNPSQNLSADESLGNSKLLPYSMLNETGFIKYIKLLNRPKDK